MLWMLCKHVRVRIRDDRAMAAGESFHRQEVENPSQFLKALVPTFEDLLEEDGLCGYCRAIAFMKKPGMSERKEIL